MLSCPGVFLNTDQKFQLAVSRAELSAHGYALGIGVLDHGGGVAESRVQLSATKETQNRPGTTGCIGFFSSDGIKNSIPRIFFCPDYNMASRV